MVCPLVHITQRKAPSGAPLFESGAVEWLKTMGAKS